MEFIMMMMIMTTIIALIESVPAMGTVLSALDVVILLILLGTQQASSYYCPQFHRGVPEELSSLSRVTQQVRKRAGIIITREGRLQGPMEALGLSVC